MSPELIAVIFFIFAIILLCLGVHIGLALALAGVMGAYAILGNFSAVIGLLKSTPYYSVSVYELSVVPLFILMGMFSLYGGISESAYLAINSWVGKIRGGLGIATVWACTAFGATSGSSVAAASVFTKVSYPEMKKAGYDPHFAGATIAVSAGIAMLIPPSLYAVIFGMLAQASIAKLLIAGVLPGLLQAITLSLGIYIMSVKNPKIAPLAKVSYNWKKRALFSAQAWPMLVLAAIIIGGIYSGIFTPTEAAAVGAFAALVISVARRKLKWDQLKTSLIETAETTAMLSLVIVGATIFSRLLTISNFPNWVGALIVSAKLSPLVLVIVMMVIFLILGCFIDAMSIMFITVPIFAPILAAAGIDLIWFGVLTTVALNMGTITPPFGLCVYTVKAVAGKDLSVEGVFRASFPMYIPVMGTLVILIAFPIIVTLLPQAMMR
jgi:tripartite ATP-independent transporter DctM subunit